MFLMYHLKNSDVTNQLYPTQYIGCSNLVYFPFVPLYPVISIAGLRLFSMEDIAAMKMNTIANRGARKDFYDIYFLLKEMTISQRVDLFKRKFKTQEVFGLFRSLTYFRDADNDKEVILIKQPFLTWEKVKKTLITETKKVFI